MEHTLLSGAWMHHRVDGRLQLHGAHAQSFVQGEETVELAALVCAQLVSKHYCTGGKYICIGG